MTVQEFIIRLREFLTEIQGELSGEDPVDPEPDPEPEPTLTLSATPASITPGQNVTLSWSTEHADGRIASGGWSGEKSVSGTETVTPTADTTYTLSVTGAGGSISKSVTVAVIAEEPDPEPEPPPPVTGDLAGTPLALVAASVAPGETSEKFVGELPDVDAWGEPVNGFGNLLRGKEPDGSGAPGIDTWTDKGHWDPIRKRSFFLGLRKANRFLSYHAIGNRWEEIPLADEPNAPPLHQHFGHLYERTALDWARGHFYRINGNTLHRYVIDEDRWEKLDDTPMGGQVIEWHYGLDRLINLKNFQLHGFRDGEFTILGETAIQGYHSSAKYNPVTGDMLLIGGNESTTKVDILTADGEIRHMKDAPFTFLISQDDLTHDPQTGSFLVLHRDKVLWEYRADLDEWRIAGDWRSNPSSFPFHGYFYHVPFPIDELGVIAWQDAGGWTVYRHRSVFTDAPPIEPVDPPDPIASPDPLNPDDPDDPDGPDGPSHGEDPAPPDVTTPIPSSETLLADAAAILQPGEWRNIAHLTTWPGKPDTSFKRFQAVMAWREGQTGGADGMGWTQNLVYHEGKLMILLMRSSFEVALMVMEADGTWWRETFPEGFTTGMGGRRPFNRLTQDATHLYFFPRSSTREEMGYAIRTPLDNPGVFERVGQGFGDDQIDTVGNFAVTYVPDWNRFYALTPGGKVWSWSLGEPKWHFHGRAPYDNGRPSGYASVVLWNPVREELIFMGGQPYGSPPGRGDKVARMVAPMGEIEALPDMQKPDGSPLLYYSSYNKLIVDPRDGSYLQLHRDGIIYRNDTAGGTWSVYEDISRSRPFGGYELYAPYAPIPGTETLVFVSHIRGVVLHRLKEQTNG